MGAGAWLGAGAGSKATGTGVGTGTSGARETGALVRLGMRATRGAERRLAWLLTTTVPETAPPQDALAGY